MGFVKEMFVDLFGEFVVIFWFEEFDCGVIIECCVDCFVYDCEVVFFDFV